MIPPFIHPQLFINKSSNLGVQIECIVNGSFLNCDTFLSHNAMLAIRKTGIEQTSESKTCYPTENGREIM